MADEKPEGAATDTPAADGAEEARTDAPAAVDDGDANGDKSEKVTIPRHEYNAIRSSREREKALEEENARLKADAEARRNPPTDRATEADRTRASIEKRERHMARLREARDAGDEASDVLLTALEAVQESEQRTLYRLQMADVPEGEREAVKAFMREQRIDMPAVAHQLMRGKKYETLEQENARLRAELDATKKPKPAPKVEDVRIVGSPGGSRAPAAKKGAPIPLAEYHERMRKDPAGTTAARKAGEFTIKVD